MRAPLSLLPEVAALVGSTDLSAPSGFVQFTVLVDGVVVTPVFSNGVEPSISLRRAFAAGAQFGVQAAGGYPGQFIWSPLTHQWYKLWPPF